MTKKSELLKWINKKGVVSSVEVTRWGLDNHYLRALRETRALAQFGIIKRINTETAILMGLIMDSQVHIGFWQANG